MANSLALAYTLYERILKRRISRGVHMRHVAVIQDGNRRYAREMGLPMNSGHSLGARTTELVSDWCLELGIKHLTVYAFSTENFNRSQEEKKYLFELIHSKLLELSTSEKVHRNQVRVRAIGRTEMLPDCLQEAIATADRATRDYKNLYLNLALAYGGQCELADAARSLATRVRQGSIRPEDVDEDLIGRYMYPFDGVPVPKVDLIIRTGGEYRTSNFLPWQANGNECAAYFCAPYWPEFRKIDFLRAVRTAQSRVVQARSLKSTGL
ncbi:MAG: di-trans,poly-cis-decaprenylcistransferase [Methanosarcinales archaeon]|nr:di-trans,poly-cis-decaprenylcistransferase [Methanosarcinales archaeon]